MSKKKQTEAEEVKEEKTGEASSPRRQSPRPTSLPP